MRNILGTMEFKDGKKCKIEMNDLKPGEIFPSYLIPYLQRMYFDRKYLMYCFSYIYYIDNKPILKNTLYFNQK